MSLNLLVLISEKIAYGSAEVGAESGMPSPAAADMSVACFVVETDMNGSFGMFVALNGRFSETLGCNSNSLSGSSGEPLLIGRRDGLESVRK